MRQISYISVLYPPYGEPWREPQRDNYLYSANERLQFAGINDYDFHARRYNARLPMFDKQDRLNEKYPWLSPYAYCAGNPVMLVDPYGMEFTKRSQKYVSNLKNTAEKKIRDNLNKIDEIKKNCRTVKVLKEKN